MTGDAITGCQSIGWCDRVPSLLNTVTVLQQAGFGVISPVITASHDVVEAHRYTFDNVRIDLKRIHNRINDN